MVMVRSSEGGEKGAVEVRSRCGGSGVRSCNDNNRVVNPMRECAEEKP